MTDTLGSTVTEQTCTHSQKRTKDTQQLATLLAEGEVRRIKWLRQSGACREVFQLLIGIKQHGNRWGKDFKDSFNKAQEAVPESWTQIIVVLKVAPTLTRLLSSPVSLHCMLFNRRQGWAANTTHADCGLALSC